MKLTARFGFTSIKSSQAYDTCRRQMTPSPLPLNVIVFFTPSLHNGKQLSVQHKHQIIIVHPICSSRCACTPSFLDCPPTSPLFYIPSPSLFQHLCWVHARASDKALCVPSLGNLPCFSSWLPAPPSWKPHNCLPFSPTLRDPASSTRLVQFAPTPPRPADAPGSKQNTLKLLDPHSPKEKVRLCLSARLWEEGGDGAKVSSHCIMRLAILQL